MKFCPQRVCESFCFDKIRLMSAEIYVMIASFVKTMPWKPYLFKA